MSESISVEEFRKMMANGQFTKKGRLQVGALPAPKTNKFGAVKVPDPEGGPDIDSTLEARHLAEARAKVKSEEIFTVARGALVYLGAGITWKIDSIIVHNDGTIEFVESKGKDTADFKLKEKLFREKYPHIKLTIRRAKGKS